MTSAPSIRILIASCLFMVLCFVSGRPQLFSDTKSYYALGQETGTLLKIPPPSDAGIALRGRPLDAQQSVSETKLAYTVAATRSPYYSLYLYILDRIGTTWAVVAAQAVLAACLLYIASRALGSGDNYLLTSLVLAGLSSLPIFIFFVMPDFFAGTSILGAALLIFYRPMLSSGERMFLWILTTAGCLFHTTHIPIIGGAAALTWLLYLVFPLGRPDVRRGSLIVVGSALIGVVGSVVYPLGVQMIRHEPIYAPPFIAARLIADGPGRDYLRSVCKGDEPYGFCHFAQQPLDDSNFILWSKEPDKTVFQAANYDLRVRIIKEQPGFVWAVIRNYPIAVAAAAWRNVYGQFFQYGTWDVLADITPKYQEAEFAIFTSLVPGTAGCRDGTISCDTRLNIRMMDDIIGTTLLVSLLVIATLLVTARVDPRRWLPLLLFVFVCFLINALVCGLLSGNSQRYQSRVTWLIPAIAMFMIGHWRRTVRSVGKIE
jgi:hypothetical protein